VQTKAGFLHFAWYHCRADVSLGISAGPSLG